MILRPARVVAALAVCGLLAAGGPSCRRRDVGAAGARDTVFAEDFESGTLAAWADGVDTARQRVLNDPTFARSGAHYLAVTYLAGGDGGWLTRFFMPGFDSLYVSYYVRFPATWRGGTKLVALYGSRTDDRWSGLGKAGTCPNGTDFFATMLITEVGGNPGPARFYTYHPAMAREPDGVTCWGRFGDGTETYTPPLTLSPGVWHHVEFWVRLNTPGQDNASERFWIDGRERGRWAGFSLRASDGLRLNALQLTFNRGVAGGPVAEQLFVDDLVVMRARPGP
ncbi:MAG TPA: hypothetical protein VF923_07630 [Gemmatimonadales bacterium]